MVGLGPVGYGLLLVAIAAQGLELTRTWST
jgi:hypothetical protein